MTEPLSQLLAKAVIASEFYLDTEDRDVLEPALSDIVGSFNADPNGGGFMPLGSYVFDGDRLRALSKWIETQGEIEMYQESKTLMNDSPTPGELIARVDDLRRERAAWHKAGQELEHRLNEAEQAVIKAIDFLKSGLNGEVAAVNPDIYPR